MPGRFDALVFDMDGVLVDSEPLHFAALNTVLGREGLQLSREENEQFIGTTSEATFSTLVEQYRLPLSMPEYMRLYDRAVLAVLEESRPPAPGVLALLDCARGLDLRVGVASSSRRLWIDATLSSLGLSDAFDAIVSGDDVSHGKPDPEIYLLAASRLSVDPGRSLAIEDAPKGVASACAAGITVLGVRTPYTAHLAVQGAVRIVDSLEDLRLPDDLRNGWLP